jgi:glyoxylase-like metal-dependent hydrolase (beta-lactamase superfamily II)
VTTHAAPLRLSADNPGPYTGEGNNTWLLDGAEPTLIDAGTGMPSHLEAVAGALDGRALARVLVTHGHSDHAAGVPALRQRWPGVEVYKLRLDGEDGWLPLADGQVVRAGDRQLVVVYTPGHAVDHVSFWDPDRREAFTGDMVIRPGSVLIPAGRGGNLRDYLRSLDRLAALDAVRLFPGHGPVIEAPAGVIAEYIEHRQVREEQVLGCLAAGVTDVDAIVARLYPIVKDDLRQAARLTVQAHLDKIRDDRL